MPPTTDELAEICRRLPEDKLRSLVDYARFLESQAPRQESSAESGDDAWERIIADPHPRPKLDAFVKQSLEDGTSEPFDLGKL